jgi:threonine/homoserine/homoserine lactone efflux protein
VLLVSSQAMAKGRNAGLAAALGVQMGNAFYLALSAAGLGLILQTSQTAFLLLKYAGAAYLIFVGLSMIARAQKTSRALSCPPSPRLWHGAFAQGLIKQLANPKAVLFFGALLPQFVGLQHATAMNFLTLGAICVAIEMPILAVYACAGAAGGTLFRGPKQVQWRERIAGGACVAVGIAVARTRNA